MRDKIPYHDTLQYYLCKCVERSISVYERLKENKSNEAGKTAEYEKRKNFRLQTLLFSSQKPQFVVTAPCRLLLRQNVSYINAY